MALYDKEELGRFVEDTFLKLGCRKDDVRKATETLLAADMRGVDSHGVARLKGYVNLFKQGRINPTPNVTVEHETPSTAVLDADSGLGLSVSHEAMRIAIEKAETVGTGWVAVKNSTHYGIAGFHAMQALEYDMIGLSMTNASPLVSPTFSRERLLGTNPIAVAIPAGQEPPFVADFATTTVANGKLEILQRNGEPAPIGWIQDEEGNPTQNASALKSGGALLPLGGDRITGSHKGYCLGAIVDIWSGVLSGANFGPWVPPFVSFITPSEEQVGEGIGHFFGAMRVDAFRKKEEFKKGMDTWIQRFRSSATTGNESKVYIPGDQERVFEYERNENGIPVNVKVEQDLVNIAEELEIASPKPKN